MKLFITLLLVLVSIQGCSSPKPLPRDKRWATAVVSPNITNFYKVDTKVFRSAQPTSQEFYALEKLHFKNIVDLRLWHDDKDELQGLHLHYYHFPLNASKVDYDDLVHIVATLQTLEGKTLVHCKHGSDRTGVIIAAYRIVAHNWSKEEALKEFRFGGFGFHSFWFQNLPKLLKNLDEKKLRKDVHLFISQNLRVVKK